MLIFHSSTVEVARPDTLHSRANLDFGPGFYATTLRDQAVRYAQRFRLRGRRAVLNTYEFELRDGLRVRRFEAYNEEWLDFVADCRRGGKAYRQYDIVMGGIANDRIFNTLDLYFSSQMPKEEALKRLMFEHPNQQVCFTSQAAIDQCLTFVGSEEIAESK